MHEITSGVKCAIKSWLAFGASITGNKPKSIRSVRRSTAASVSDLGAAIAPQSRMRVMFRSSTDNENQLRFDEEMGPEMQTTSWKARRATKALADLNKGDDKQTRKAAEHVQKVCDVDCFIL